ncbi:E3 ubiquitin-protein ligase NEURL3-like [Pimephales promelas]|uniref:E3 ubiquitin-protein ligase NEURL3-like n=1 Tax=Pimephales promelas TaxID=90988 RepID=UPI0019556CC2|nr:E3 ubiquitin-protein ligase NEURL3-like [Pimephales promelas]KAG1974152.1 E3 ubiquitin-protein ligase NEURL3 [Pimephales promelas]
MTEKKKEKVKCVCHAHGSLRAICFHSEVKGPLITLSDGGHRVTRDGSSFCHGVTFSGRQVKIQEKVRLRVEHCVRRWHGALRVGFTHVLPHQTTLPSLAIPDLTHSPLFAAVVVPEGICRPGSEIQFWLKKNGCLRIRTSDGRTHTEQTSLNTNWPVWAMVDVYGQTTSVMMLGSKKRCCIFTRRSCPALTHIQHTEDKEMKRKKEQMSTLEQRNPYLVNTDHETPDCEECVVCYSDVANIRLSCGHKCVCTPCSMRVYMTFGTCPLCRCPMRSFKPYE